MKFSLQLLLNNQLLSSNNQPKLFSQLLKSSAKNLWRRPRFVKSKGTLCFRNLNKMHYCTLKIKDKRLSTTYLTRLHNYTKLSKSATLRDLALLATKLTTTLFSLCSSFLKKNVIFSTLMASPNLSQFLGTTSLTPSSANLTNKKLPTTKLKSRLLLNSHATLL